MKLLVITLTVLLAVLHQDFWWWDSKSVAFGFLPVGLAWHAGISACAAVVGWLAVRYCWPVKLDEEERRADKEPRDGSPSNPIEEGK